MSEINLFLYGTVVFFIAVAGAYVYARERFVYTDASDSPARPAPVSIEAARHRRSSGGSPRRTVRVGAGGRA